MTHLPRLASLVFNRPHYITRDAGLAIASVITRGEVMTPAANRFAGDEQFERDDQGRLVTNSWGDPKRKGYRMFGATAIVNVIGELVNRGAWLGASSGLVSYEGLAQQLKAAAADPRAKHILLDVNSPGGEAAGMTDIAALVRAIAAEKPVVAVCNSMMASAAYGLCSGATRIVTTDLGVVGSIGVVMMHADYSMAIQDAGMKITLIHKGEHKVDGNPFEALPDDVRDDFQAECGKYYDAFVKCVAAGRPRLSEAAIRATEARCYLGAEAVDAGLADAVGTFDQILADLEAGRMPGASAVPTKPPATVKPTRTLTKESTMTDKTHTQADVDGARAAGTAAGATAERSRIKAILGADAAKGRADMAAHLAFETEMAADAACALLDKAPKAEAKPAAPAAAQTPAATPAVMGLELAAPVEPAKAEKKAVNSSDIYAARRKAN